MKVRRTRTPCATLLCGLATLTALTGAACADGTPTRTDPIDADVAFSPTGPGAPGLVEITARGLTLEGPDEIPSGWTTLRLANESGMIHFAALQKVPDGIGIEDQQAEVAPVFQEGMDLLNAGDVDAALAAFGKLPAWFFEVVFLGGPGLTSAGESAETTVHLEPGTYLLECYVKTNGTFHSFNDDPETYGMVMEITVTEEDSRARAPRPTIDLAISSGEDLYSGGITGDDPVRPGRHTVAVHFEDQAVHEHFLGHDVHLARLGPDADLAELATWMNWTGPTGLDTPEPAGVEFLGGIHEMPAGETGYFDVLLTPGCYAWVAEVPDPAGKGMLRTFSVPAGRGGCP